MVAGTHAIISRDVRQEKLHPICVLCNLCANLVTRAPINIRPADKTFFHIDLAIAMHSRVCLSKNNCKNYRNKSCALSKMKFVRVCFVFYFRLVGRRAFRKCFQLIAINKKKNYQRRDYLIHNVTVWKSSLSDILLYNTYAWNPGRTSLSYVSRRLTLFSQ